MGVRVPMLLLLTFVTSACSHNETTGYCDRSLPTPSPGTVLVSTVEVENGDLLSGFPEGVRDFYVIPRRTPKPVGNGVTRVQPYLSGVSDGSYRATFATFPVPRWRHHGVRMTVASQTFTLEGPVTCE
jgi:hypothetical protein